MKQVKSVIFAALAAGLFAASAFAQSQNIPTPASSADRGGRAVVGFTVPAPVTQAQVQQMVNQGIGDAVGAGRSWTVNFIGQQKCWYNGSWLMCSSIDTSGNMISTSSYGGSWLTSANGGFANGNAALSMPATLYNSPVGQLSFVPVGHDAFGSNPTGWTGYYTYCDPGTPESAVGGGGTAAYCLAPRRVF